MYGIDESTLIEDRGGSGLFQLVHISGVSHLFDMYHLYIQWIEN